MKVLILKTSSLGDVIHTLPAITEASIHIPEIRFDWVVEELFAEVPKWHRSVSNVIPIAIRRWRKNICKAIATGEIRNFWRRISAAHYDCIIDAQGLLLKSSMVSCMAKGTRCGYDWSSAREPLASIFYNNKYAVDKNQHAITRVRQLFANCLDYVIDPNAEIDYGINFKKINTNADYANSIVLIPNTSREEKYWPENNWQQLIDLLISAGYIINIIWGSENERIFAERLANNKSHVTVLEKKTLTELGEIFSLAKGAVSVDTGLGHLAAAVGLPTVSLYGPTDLNLIGTVGLNQTHLKTTADANEVFKRTLKTC